MAKTWNSLKASSHHPKKSSHDFLMNSTRIPPDIRKDLSKEVPKDIFENQLCINCAICWKLKGRKKILLKILPETRFIHVAIRCIRNDNYLVIDRIPFFTIITKYGLNSILPFFPLHPILRPLILNFLKSYQQLLFIYPPFTIKENLWDYQQAN